MTDLEEQLAQLREERQALAASIQDTGDDVVGDTGDQAETLERMSSLNALDERIEQMITLQEERARQPLNPSGDEVAPGTTVTLKYDDGATETMQVVVSILEENDGDPVMTPESPLGRALMGKAVGDRVSYEAPTGTLAVEVVDIQVSTQE